MEKLFTVNQAARATGLTAETLRHYDRIDLVKPNRTDEWTGYRYYSQSEIVRLNTVKALRNMGLTLAEIKNILEPDDLNKIIALLNQAEKNADVKIAELEYAKNKIRRARLFYETKLRGETNENGIYIKTFPQRTILLSDTLESPTLSNLWNYHRHFYDRLPDCDRDAFSFEDLAGVYEKDGIARMFAVCTRYKDSDGLKILPKGKYLCADCTEENRTRVLRNLTEIAREQYGAIPKFTVQYIVLSGILQWNYQIQIPI